MDNAVDLFRQRRQKRIEARKDAGDIQWISTEEGSHIPLQNGKSVGGWSKGKDFSSAKTEKSAPKGTSTPTQKLSRDLKKCQSKNEYGAALGRASKGSKVYLKVGDTVDGFEKVGNGMYGQWKRIYGTGSKGEFLGGDKLAIRAEASEYCGTTAKVAHQAYQDVLPRYHKEYGRRVSSEGKSRDNVVGQYYKSLSGKKELIDALKDKQYKITGAFHNYLKKQGIDTENVEYDPDKRRFKVTTEVSKGRGKPKEKQERFFDTQVNGGKYTYVKPAEKTKRYGDDDWKYMNPEKTEYVFNFKFKERDSKMPKTTDKESGRHYTSSELERQRHEVFR